MSPSFKRSDYARIKERIPRAGTGRDNLIAQLERLLGEPSNKFIQKIVIEADKPYIHLEKLLHKDEAPESETGITFHEAVRQKPMEELKTDTEEPLEVLAEAIQSVNLEGFEVCCVLIGTDSQFYTWMALKGRRWKKVVGIPIEEDKDIPKDIFIVCGAMNRDATPEDVTFSMKVAMSEEARLPDVLKRAMKNEATGRKDS